MSLLPWKICKNYRAQLEPIPGVVLERRKLLWASLGTLAAFTMTPWNAVAGRRVGKAQQAISWDVLVQRAVTLAEGVTQGQNPNEEAYLVELSRLMERAGEIPRASFDLAAPVATYETLRRLPLLIVQFRLAPGAVIPYHDHRDYIGALTVAEGELRIRSFDIVRDHPHWVRDQPFRIRETQNAVLTRGCHSTLSGLRNNIHDLRAGPKGARLIDVYTLRRSTAHSVYLNVAERPKESASRIFDARWASEASLDFR